MLQIAEISGSPVFEEVVRVEDIVALRTPLKDQLMEAARNHAGSLLEAAGGETSRRSASSRHTVEDHFLAKMCFRRSRPPL